MKLLLFIFFYQIYTNHGIENISEKYLCVYLFKSESNLQIECASLNKEANRVLLTKCNKYGGNNFTCEYKPNTTYLKENVKESFIDYVFNLQINNCNFCDKLGEIVKVLNGRLEKVEHLKIIFTKYEDENISVLKKKANLLMEQIDITNSTRNFFKLLPKLKNFNLIGSSSFSKLPEKICSNTTIEDVHIENAHFRKIPKHFLEGCSNLRKLQMIGLFIQFLPVDLFQDSQKLSELNLSKNKIESLPLGIFKGLFDLKTIVLKENKLKCLIPDVFIHSYSLIYIDLSKNHLSNLSGLYFYEQMEKIDLSFNNLNSEKTMFSTGSVFEEVKVLNLSHNKLSQIERGWTYNWLGLEILDLSFNNFEGDIMLRKLSFLKHFPLNFSVDLSNNQVERIIFPTNESNENNEDNQLNLILSNNPFKCDCFATELNELLEEMKTIGIKKSSFKHISLEIKNYPCENNTIEELICHEECSDNCTCHINRFRQEFTMNCTHRNMNRFPARIPSLSADIKKIILLFSHNNLTTFEENIFMENKSYHLDLSNNQISSLQHSFLPTSIKTLYLNNNKIDKFNLSSIRYFESLSRRKSVELKLGHNPYRCNCESLPFLQLIKNIFLNISDYDTISFSCLHPLFINHARQEDLCTEITQLLLLPLVCCLFFAAMLLILVLWYSNSFKIWLFSQSCASSFFSEDLVDKDKKYDAFISYSHHDSEFVENILWKELETPSNPKDIAYKCKVHTRDFVPGQMIPDQILASIQESRRTIIVLSKEYVQADWTRMEFKEAHSQSIRDKKQVYQHFNVSCYPKFLEVDLTSPWGGTFNR